MFKLQSPAFDNLGYIPPLYARSRGNVSPPLKWSDPPNDAKSFAVVCEDPDATHGAFFHWAIWNIPGDLRELPENFLPEDEDTNPGIRVAINDFGRRGYDGPCPPRGLGSHHYRFHLLALDVENLPIDIHAKCKAAAAVMRAHSIASAELTGLYER